MSPSLLRNTAGPGGALFTRSRGHGTFILSENTTENRSVIRQAQHSPRAVASSRYLKNNAHVSRQRLTWAQSLRSTPEALTRQFLSRDKPIKVEQYQQTILKLADALDVIGIYPRDNRWWRQFCPVKKRLDARMHQGDCGIEVSLIWRCLSKKRHSLP